MSDQRQWIVTLAACWPNRTWTEELVDLDESDFPHLDENGPSDGEIAEAAHDRFLAEFEQQAEKPRGEVEAVAVLHWKEDENAKVQC